MPRKKIVKNEAEPEVKAPEPVVPEPVIPPAEEVKPLRTFRVERKVESGDPRYEQKLPEVRGGVCTFCGILDKNVPSHLQHTLCPHYQGIDLKCSYCPPTTKEEEAAIMRVRKFDVFLFEGAQNLTVVCDDIRCRGKHFDRIRKARI